MSYFLFLDDIRDVKDVTWRNIPPGNWVTVRNYDEFREEITNRGIPCFVSFDHDLADNHYGGKYDEKTGASCARWLANYCFENNLDLPKYEVHSMNPVGSENIRSILSSYQTSRLNTKCKDIE